MKTVLVITEEAANRLLYENVLKGRFSTRFSAKATGGTGTVDAIVYDIPGLHQSLDLRWIESLDTPTVVLTSETRLPLSDTPTRRILSYPATGSDLLKALASLGLT